MPRSRDLFTNRTLNLRAIKAIGYDLDYTLVHYNMAAWERRAYHHLRARLLESGLPVGDLAFDPDLAAQGLILDKTAGNLVKANRFGYVKQACHGTRMLTWDEWRTQYARTPVDLREPRWEFLNSLFSVSEACMVLQLVDLHDAGRLPGVHGYEALTALVRGALSEAHADGLLKQEILADPTAFVDLDPDVALTLLDQKHAGKTLLLITNSEYEYGSAILDYALGPFLPAGSTWRDVFDVSFFAARKPHFFSTEMPIFRVIDDTGLLRPHVGPVRRGGVYVGGSAAIVERSLDLRGEDVLYVGDHVYTDVNVTKQVLRWRTALVLRALEAEVAGIEGLAEQQTALSRLMDEKSVLEQEKCRLKLALQRLEGGYGPPVALDADALHGAILANREAIAALDERIAPLAIAVGRLGHPRWGPTMRTGNDKSHLARQVERYADVYTSRVSNFGRATPHAYLRSPRGSLPHDP